MGQERRQVRQPATKQPQHQKKQLKNRPAKPDRPGQKFR
uniref:Uncharacterized protein n=1 Tax=Rubinisphaera brasiliensis (strain ATCC 49424 / DSM 5305 / JCM 21570 / IAM 15109 / NBRC 103401 / IFAM 1448) TaxID=756272 RepID=F0SMN9_RUBBR|nr:hypothetical protein Plabr_1245 [Rubinisphaera brasiliensis DSM 5305]